MKKTRHVNGGQGVGQSGRRAAQPKRQSRHLPDAPVDFARLERQPYLTIPELCAYGSFKTKNAAYHFLAKHQVPWASGRVRRRDFDLTMQRLAEERGRSGSGRRHGRQSLTLAVSRSSELSSPEAR